MEPNIEITARSGTSMLYLLSDVVTLISDLRSEIIPQQSIMSHFLVGEGRVLDALEILTLDVAFFTNFPKPKDVRINSYCYLSISFSYFFLILH